MASCSVGALVAHASAAGIGAETRGPTRRGRRFGGSVAVAASDGAGRTSSRPGMTRAVRWASAPIASRIAGGSGEDTTRPTGDVRVFVATEGPPSPETEDITTMRVRLKEKQRVLMEKLSMRKELQLELRGVVAVKHPELINGVVPRNPMAQNRALLFAPPPPPPAPPAPTNKQQRGGTIQYPFADGPPPEPLRVDSGDGEDQQQVPTPAPPTIPPPPPKRQFNTTPGSNIMNEAVIGTNKEAYVNQAPPPPPRAPPPSPMSRSQAMGHGNVPAVPAQNAHPNTSFPAYLVGNAPKPSSVPHENANPTAARGGSKVPYGAPAGFIPGPPTGGTRANRPAPPMPQGFPLRKPPQAPPVPGGGGFHQPQMRAAPASAAPPPPTTAPPQFIPVPFGGKATQNAMPAPPQPPPPMQITPAPARPPMKSPYGTAPAPAFVDTSTVEGAEYAARLVEPEVVPLPHGYVDPVTGEPVDGVGGPPALCVEKLNVVVVAAECAPFAKTGGLGDVAKALPKALQRRGHRVMVVMPRYENYEGAIDTGVRVKFNIMGEKTEVGYFHMHKDGIDTVFIDHPAFHAVAGDIYKGDRREANFRNAMLCQAAIEAVWHVPCDDPSTGIPKPYGDSDLVYMANDWHTALLPVFLQAFYQDHGKLPYARSVFVIHNMAFQGRGPIDEFRNLGIPDSYRDDFFLDDPFGGECMNCMQAGLRLATKVIAVSQGYAWEITTDMGGWGLAPLLREFGEGKLTGVVNGIDLDEWSPDADDFLLTDGYAQFAPDATGLQGKLECKRALQKQLGLPVRDDVPLLGFIGRLDHQKGVDLITDAAGWLLGQDVQLIMLGSGRDDLEASLRKMENENRDKARCWVGFSVEMAHRITAGCDILLMPSRFEPCGLNQLYAMRYGTVPVVHAVGGLRETVVPYDPQSDTGTGWQFDEAVTDKFKNALGYALGTFRDQPEEFKKIQCRGMAQDLSWELAAERYEEKLIEAKYSW